MNGIEILASQEVATNWTYNWMLVCVAACVSMFIFAFIGIWVSIKECNGIYAVVIISVGVLLTILIVIPFMAITETPIEYETRYKVTISDEVSMNEFLDKYKIISQEGQIYTIREKE